MLHDATNLSQKVASNYTCIFCDYNTCKPYDYEKHIKTIKHKKRENATNATSNVAKVAQSICECGRQYKHSQSLSRHKKTCVFLEDNLTNSIIPIENENKDNNKDDNEKSPIDYKYMFLKILDENSEFKNILITQQNQLVDQQKQIMDQQNQIGELIPKVGNNNNNNTNIKQKFNINIFLNEQCKDALNMDEFLKQITVTLENLDVTKTKGLCEGLSNVFIENMNKLSVFKRPLHCTDVKRETLYIKENDTWGKDNDKSKIRAAIKNASATQYKNMKQWMDANPDYMDDPDKQDYFIHMVKNCGKSINDIDDKIIKKICSTSYIKDILHESQDE